MKHLYDVVVTDQTGAPYGFRLSSVRHEAACTRVRRGLRQRGEQWTELSVTHSKECPCGVPGNRSVGYKG